MVEVEQEIYTVVEGNYLEVCVVIVGGGVAAFPFNVTGTVYCKLLQEYMVAANCNLHSEPRCVDVQIPIQPATQM